MARVRVTPRPLPPVARRADRLGLVLPMQLRATPQAPQKTLRAANDEARLRMKAFKAEAGIACRQSVGSG